MVHTGAGEGETLLVGLDAACPRVLDEVFAADAAPALQGLFEAGAAGPLASQVPPWTASAWPSLSTGANPGRHGAFGFLDFEGYDWDVVDATVVREWSLWELCDRHGLTSVVVNVPVTHPPPAVDGAVVPGYVGPDLPDCHPGGTLDDLRSALGEYRVYPDVDRDAPAGEKVAEFRRLAGLRGAAYRRLADRFDPDFGFLQFQATDTVLHEFPGDLERACRVYRAVDDALGRVLDARDPETVVVASDHGMGPYEVRFRANEYLRDAGYVAATRGGSGMPDWSAIRDRGLQGTGDGSGTGDASLAGAVLSRLARLGLTSQRAGAVLDRLGLAGAALRLAPAGAVRAASEQVDFPASRAYVRSRTRSGVRINLQGREPDGVVAPAEYESVRESLVEALSAARRPDGRPVFEDVAPREAYFDGPHVEAAPDVVVVPDGFDVYLTTWLLGDRFETPDGPAWDHTRTGVVALAGDGVDPDADLSGAHLFDVAPTVLAALGLPASDRMDGEVLPAVESAGVASYPSYEAAGPPTAEAGRNRRADDGTAEEHLAALGYVE